jgi:hypothetical protein
MPALIRMTLPALCAALYCAGNAMAEFRALRLDQQEACLARQSAVRESYRTEVFRQCVATAAHRNVLEAK